MEKKVESREQSGGITAERVNITNKHVTINKGKNEKQKKNKTLKNLITAIMVLAAIATILTYLSTQTGKPPYTNDKGHQIQPNK